MGHGIAHVFATAGYQVRGFDDVPAAAQFAAHLGASANLKQMVSAGVIKKSRIGRIP